MAQVKLQALPGTSLKSLVNGYFLTHQSEGRSPNTVAYYRGILSRWGIAGNGSESSSRRAAPRTVHHYYRALHAFFNWVVREGFPGESPMAKVKVAKPKRKVIKPYSSEQINKMLIVCDWDYQHDGKSISHARKERTSVLRQNCFFCLAAE